MVKLCAVVLSLCFTVTYSELIPMDCDLKRQIVDTHNLLRLNVASGQVPGQPAASRMSSLVWDKELAEKAENWARNNKFMHNPDHTIPSQRFETGENLYISGTTEENPAFNIKENIYEWFEEYKDYSYKPMDFSYSKAVILHYTQMVWEKTLYIGCAVSKFNEDGYKNTLLVCNYGPQGNQIGEVPYPAGNPSYSLFCGASDCTRPYGKECPRQYTV